MTRSRTLTFTVKRKTGDAFDAILNSPPKIMPGAKKSEDGWWSFLTSRGQAKLKFSENRSLGILDHMFVDQESEWNVPMRVVSSGDESEVIITLIKPDQITDDQFNQRMGEIAHVFQNLKDLIEKS